MERKLLVSRIQTPDGTILESKHTHDYVTHIDENGHFYMLDGGTDYQRMSFPDVFPPKDMSIYSDDDYEVIRTNLKRGTFDKEGERIWKPISELSNKHLDNILVYNEERGFENSVFSEMVKKEIEYRKEKNILIEDNY